MLPYLSQLKKFDRVQYHQQILRVPDKDLLLLDNVQFVFDPQWEVTNPLSIQISTQLLDSYYNLSERPDLAFNSLWSAVNSFYKDFKLESLSLADWAGKNHSLNDNVCIRFILDHMLMFLGTTPEKGKLLSFIKKVPEKHLKFFSSQFLKSYVHYKFTQNYYNCAGFYSKFGPGFSDVDRAFSDSFGDALWAISSMNISGNLRILKINNDNKSRKIIHACSVKLFELLGTGKTSIDNHKAGTGHRVYNLTLSEDEIIKFVFRYIIYASRNQTVHGQAAPRMLSPNFDVTYYRSSVYLYFLTYLYFAIFLYSAQKADKIVVDQAYANISLI